jgi:hypothetical protein
VDVEQSGVRCWRLLQIDRRVRENKRGKGGGGVGSVPRGGRKTGERESPGHGGRQRGQWGWNGSRQHSQRRCARGGGRLTNRGGRRGMGDAVRLTGGAGRQRGPVVSNRVREEERKVR